MQARLAHALQHSDSLRRAGQWAQARDGYLGVLQNAPDHAVAAHNLALCHLALGEAQEALARSRQALQLNPALWQSALVHAKALISRGDKGPALALLDKLQARQPANAEICIELGRLALQHGGDAARAAQLVEPFLEGPHAREARMLQLIAQLYDRPPQVSAADLSQGLIAFADAHLQLPGPAPAPVQAPRRTRPRVGLLSPQFTASPVYFFTFGALERLAREVDLVFFSRGSKVDWATNAFRALAADWIDVAQQSATVLAQTLSQHDLDVLIDLGGWMDPVALQALSGKPAKRMYKWVGGQSATTGLRVFDGFITDRYQTPAGTDHLYSEPLLRLKAGYVTYTPPPYLPAARKSRRRQVRLGVIANPTKVSRAFLADLHQRWPQWQEAQTDEGRSVVLQFIDYRYQNETLRRRVEDALPGVDTEFITPSGHLEYLTAVSQLDATLDSWPYSGGLTTIEALAVGVPAYTRVGQLFCERHTVAHCQYAGLRLAQFRMDRFDGLAPLARSGHSLLRADSPRMDHDALANELLSHLLRR